MLPRSPAAACLNGERCCGWEQRSATAPGLHQGFSLPTSFSCKDLGEEASYGAFSFFQALLRLAEFMLTPRKDGGVLLQL